MPPDKTKTTPSSNHRLSPYDRESDAGSTHKSTGDQSTITATKSDLIHSSGRLQGRGTAHEVLKCISKLRRTGKPYSIDVEIVHKQPEQHGGPSIVSAPCLKSVKLVIKDGDPSNESELTRLLDALQAPDLKKASILCLGESTGACENAAYKFLETAGESGKLTTVILSLRCRFKDPLKKYLRSSAAKHLTTLFLHTNAFLEDELVPIIPQTCFLSNLEKLVLRNAVRTNADPVIFFSALQRRHNAGNSKLRAVRITVVDGIPAEVVARAHAIGIEYQAYRRVSRKNREWFIE
ncbi:hypothetical protein BD626DRAFT_120144 [Schizophyllum amplum]|uniref:Uncharacterized protein n=1 Tax=Schizophyllum amplum TaxID=97359 RepID=A0A550CVA6_9AGAR|nr:hypothetical protein BD626DRAFT_120144 [Auriculariopsis ampla]